MPWCCVSESEDMQHWNLRLQNWCQQWAPHGILSLWQHLFRVTHSNSRNLIVVASRQILLSHSIVWINYSSLNQWSAWAFRHNDAGSQVTSWKEPWGHMRLITVRGQCTQHYVTCEQLMSMAVGILMIHWTLSASWQWPMSSPLLTYDCAEPAVLSAGTPRGIFVSVRSWFLFCLCSCRKCVRKAWVTMLRQQWPWPMILMALTMTIRLGSLKGCRTSTVTSVM